MYIIRGRPRGMITYKPKRPIVHKNLIVNSQPKMDAPKSDATIDIEQSGSGMKGIKNKLTQIALHSDEKKKFNKFISWNL